jgi:hypothetical protein
MKTGPSSSIRTAIPLLTPPTLLVAALASCADGDSTVLTAVRDSAGVVIVESSGAPATDAGGWSVDPVPGLSIGTLEGDADYQLYRVNGACVLSDGGIAVGNDGSSELRIYDREGAFRVSLGAEGEGPGEFRSLRLVGRYGGDTLVIVDSRLRRISLFHPDAGLLGSAAVAEELAPVRTAEGMLGDGSLVLSGIRFGEEPPADGPVRIPQSYRLARIDGSLAADFGELPGREAFQQVQGAGGELVVSISLMPLGKQPAAAASSDRVFLGSSDRYEILAYDASARLQRIIRVDQPMVALEASDWNWLMADEIGDDPDPIRAAEIRQRYRELPVPETLPAYLGFRTDARGYLWVEEARRPGDDTPLWTVFNREGTPLARVTLPDRTRILEIGEDYVLAVRTDELEVEYVELYPLHRG